jgi:hypothetical protein
LFKLLLVIFTIIIITTSSADAKDLTLGDRWEMLNNALKESENTNYFWASKKLAEAKQIYSEYFKEAAQKLDPESDQIIENALDYNSEHIKTRDLLEASFNRQAIDKSIYKIAFLKIEKALDKGDAKTFLEWYPVMEKKFALSKNPSLVTNKAVDEIKKDQYKIYKYRDTIKSELLNIFKIKTIEEIEEAIAATDQSKTNDAIKFTYEGYYYYRTLHPHLVEKLGQEDAQKIESNIWSAMQVTRSGASNHEIKSKLEQILHNIEPGVKGYQGQTQAGMALGGMRDRLHLVEEEYRDAVTDGKITNQVEYDETVVFLQKAATILDQNRADLESLDRDAISAIDANIKQIDQIVVSFGEFSELQSLVRDSMDIIDELSDKAGVSENGTDYFGQIRQLLEQTKSEYLAGNTEKAQGLATEAYLDNYEFLEAPIAEHDKELMGEIEIMMRIDLINMIKDNKPVDSHIDDILAKLDRAEALLSDNVIEESALPPIVQIQAGLEPEEVECAAGKLLILKKTANESACVSPQTYSKLIQIGWGMAS